MQLPFPFSLPELPHFNRQRLERINAAHELAIATGLDDQLAGHDYIRWGIDRYELLKEEVDGDRLYTVHFTGWLDEEEAIPGAYDVWSGEADGAIQALSWMPL